MSTETDLQEAVRAILKALAELSAAQAALDHDSEQAGAAWPPRRVPICAWRQVPATGRLRCQAGVSLVLTLGADVHFERDEAPMTLSSASGIACFWFLTLAG